METTAFSLTLIKIDRYEVHQAHIFPLCNSEPEAWYFQMTFDYVPIDSSKSSYSVVILNEMGRKIKIEPS